MWASRPLVCRYRDAVCMEPVGHETRGGCVGQSRQQGSNCPHSGHQHSRFVPVYACMRVVYACRAWAHVNDVHSPRPGSGPPRPRTTCTRDCHVTFSQLWTQGTADGLRVGYQSPGRPVQQQTGVTVRITPAPSLRRGSCRGFSCTGHRLRDYHGNR